MPEIFPGDGRSMNNDSGQAPAFRIRPAKKSDLARISELQQKLYSSADAVPLAVLQSWYQANPNGFLILEDENSHLVGQITFLPLKPACLTRYREEGETGMIETEITGAHIHSPEESQDISDLYLESLILPSENRGAAREILLRALPGLIARLAPQGERGMIHALAATEAGERWLTRMGFTKISRAEYRRDGHNMFGTNRADFIERTSLS